MVSRWQVEADGLDGALAALGTTFEPAVDPERPVRRTWLDTFDWRLHRAGVAAEYVEIGQVRELVVHRHGAEPLTTPIPLTRWPALSDSLPDGPVGELLAPLIDIRALFPITRERGHRQQINLLNEDAKTVARLHVETGHDTGVLTLEPLRGYAAAAGRVAKILDGKLAAADPDLAHRQAVSGSARAPGDYTGGIATTLDARMKATTAISHVLHDLLGQTKDNIPGTKVGLDTEFLHDLRVAVRRTRSAVKLCSSAVEIDPEFATELRWLGDVTSRPRDLDVYLLEVPELAEALVAAEPDDLDPLIAHLADERANAQEILVAELRGVRLRRLLNRWRQVVAELVSLPSAGAPKAAELAATVIGKADRRVVKLGSAITDESPAEALHDLRKRAKELRYSLEIFGSLYDPAELKKVVSQLKRLQDVLGRFQDTEVQRGDLGAMAGTLASGRRRTPVPTLLAMGELAGHLAREQERARSEFADRWAEFGSEAQRRRIATLVASAR